MNQKIAKLIRKYCKVMNLKDENAVKRIFQRGDIYQKKRDLIAMRGAIYAKTHVKLGMSLEEQQEIMENFTKTENLTNVRWPKIKVKVDE